MARPTPIVGLLAAAGLPALVQCCTYFELPFPAAVGNGTSYMVGRTMELSNILGRTTYQIEVVPKSLSGGQHAYVGLMNFLTFDTRWEKQAKLKIPFEGMNEHGLTISTLEFQEAVYEKPALKVKSVHNLLVLHELLARCDNVQSALDHLASVRVVGDGILPGVHWAITDPSGRSVVVEYLRGQRVVLENAPRVMTNDPNLEWQWRNLDTYANLSPRFPHENDFLQVDTDAGNAGGGVGMVPRAVGHGWNLFGLPGDFSAPSRFVRMFYLKGYAMKREPPQNSSDAHVLGAALLNNVFIPRGSVAGDSRSWMDTYPENTPYAVLKNPQERKLLVRAYANAQWREIDLSRLDFGEARAWPLEDGTLGIKDITAEGADDVPAGEWATGGDWPLAGEQKPDFRV
uniref:Choloylglycine hydrolase/NAAA C-terminal domain-containing protein n=1 Tax=Zooxanthella nutricula TaxID=1333877 RepID=A0A7S2IM13_9DINO